MITKLSKSSPILVIQLLKLIVSTYYVSNGVIEMYPIAVGPETIYFTGFAMNQPVTIGMFKMILGILTVEFASLLKLKKEQFEKENIRTVLGDLEKDLSHTVDNIDKVIFAAGSGGKKVVEVDQEGAKNLI